MKMFIKKILFFLLLSLVLNIKSRGQKWIVCPTNAFANWINIHDLDVSGDSITVEALVSVFDFTTTDILSKHIGFPDNNYLFRPAAFALTTNVGYQDVSNPVTLCVDSVYHLAATYDGDSIKYYLNGIEVASKHWTGSLIQNNFNTAIGNREWQLDEQFKGAIDEVRIWKKARTQTEIFNNMYDLPNPTTQQGLLAYYKFEGNYTNLQGNSAFNGMPNGAILYLGLNPYFHGKVSTTFCNPVVYLNVYDSICSGDTLFGYDKPGTYIDSFINSYSGYDTIRTLHLTINSSSGPPPKVSTFNSGTNNTGGTLPKGSKDLNWKVSQISIKGPYSPAIVMSSIPGVYYSSPWPDCAWITDSKDGFHNANADFYYKIEFNLPCNNLCGLKYDNINFFCLNLDFFADNSVYEIYVNSLPQSSYIGNMPLPNPYNQNGLESAGIRSVSLCRDWKSGSNSLIIHIKSSPDREGFLSQASIVSYPLIPTDTINATICKGDAFSFGSQNLTDSGSYIEKFHTLQGCDSIVLLKLKLLEKSFATINQSICDGQTYLGHNTSGTYIDTLVAANGCDSIRTLNLIVKTKSNSTINQSICDGQIYLGHNTSGTFIDTLVAANGCDSIRTLNLIVKTKSNSTINQSICDGQTYLGHNTSGTFIDTLVAANGCDSIRTLNLTVKPKSFSQINKSICQGESYFGYYTSGTYIDTFATLDGCDSIRTLNLTIKQKSITTIKQSICIGQSYLGYTTAGNYIDTFQTSNGCDSIRNLILTVLALPNPNLGPDTELCKGDSLVLSPGNFATYLWQDSSTLNHYVVKVKGLYNVIVSNACGSNSDQILISENFCNEVFPTAFTPNNDGKNDYFKILNAFNLKGYYLSIYNRWGKKVFETTDYKKGWDGTLKGNQQDIGNFVYYCKYTKEGKEIRLKGSFLLLR